MPGFTTLKLVCEPGVLAGPSTQREKRRAYISPDVLRTYKVAAGSWAVVSHPHPAGENGGGSQYTVLQLWPRATADPECMLHDVYHQDP